MTSKKKKNSHTYGMFVGAFCYADDVTLLPPPPQVWH